MSYGNCKYPCTQFIYLQHLRILFYYYIFMMTIRVYFTLEKNYCKHEHITNKCMMTSIPRIQETVYTQTRIGRKIIVN